MVPSDPPHCVCDSGIAQLWLGLLAAGGSLYTQPCSCQVPLALFARIFLSRKSTYMFISNNNIISNKVTMSFSEPLFVGENIMLVEKKKVRKFWSHTISQIYIIGSIFLAKKVKMF